MGSTLNGATNRLFRILEENHRSRPIGIYSVCSANRYVLEAGMIQAQRDDSLLLIESTSNQVNQFGGYTGQTPVEFAAFLHELARSHRFPSENIILGGDHLGPQLWRKEVPESAMQKACVLVQDCVLAGYTKIHLDASMPLGENSGTADEPLSDEIVSGRAAELCLAAEQAHQRMGTGSTAPLYVVGTEVPIPGGEQLGSLPPQITGAHSVEQTLRLTKQAFYSRGLHAAWERVIAVVVQPGVEFGDSSVFSYDHAKASPLSRFIEQSWHGVYEAHSTDYQTPSALRQMVQDHFAILKVGPWLTFAFREAVFGLAAVEEEWLGNRAGIQTSKIREELERAMQQDPSHWKSYYHGDEASLLFSRKYSYSDRSRYYWPNSSVANSLGHLIANLRTHPAPLALLSQYLPKQSEAVCEGLAENDPAALIRHNVLEVLSKYSLACGMQMAQGTCG
ncbi:MAG TPA: class II D-tagatose-bisphosphate aldolase, non-catalytic subunit [Candidatus Acidoferrum sp.]|jgi:D-tagatose-1,6-bisphosphate aldolase subunit GatZ/KbaZ